ncbi:MAG: hypothetical protein J07HB67_01310 [halophilic archaeon J07HB67]|jgi:hypothetical protein|nr:MAG: hypothetical protein J07HB67_01310 [halophilic archaeon J07HB67]
MDVVSLPAAVVGRYRRFSLYNSPYPAHDAGHGIDLYPASNVGVSPVAGRVLDTRTVGCPDRSYAADTDHLILIDTGASDTEPGESGTGGAVARVLHVDPAVSAGDRVAVGDPLGRMVRSGFFGPWVDNHVHVDFRDPEDNLYRATGSLPVDVETPVVPAPWDGTGRVVDTGETYAVLDAPTHPAPDGESYATLASDDGVPLDGGLPHYTGGGRLDRTLADADEPAGETLSFLGTTVGHGNGRTVTWTETRVTVDREPVTGLSLFASREPGFGAKIVSRPEAGQPSFSVGETVAVAVESVETATRLG